MTMTSDKTKFDFAVSYARRGWAVFPCNGKIPLTEHGFKDATTDEAQLMIWWMKSPEAGIGISTGQESRIFVLDIDPRHGGDETLRELEEQHGKFPETLEVLTGGGGFHLYFKYPENFRVKSRNGIFEGIDVKADGGYVIAPPSVHASGRRYEWEASTELFSPAEAPEWLLQVLTKEDHTPGNDGTKEIPDRIAEGSRNNALTSLAGSMRRRGASEEAIGSALLAENVIKCDPPLPEKEVRTIAKSVSKYDPASEKYHLTDMGNAKRLVRKFGDVIRYCFPKKKWFFWDGVRWIEDNFGKARYFAKETVLEIYEEASHEKDDARRQEISKFAVRCEEEHQLEDMLSLSQSEPGIAIMPEDFDAKRWLINLKNGTLDLKTGNLQPHRREDFLTKLAPVEYDPEAVCPLWESFQEKVSLGNLETVRFKQKAYGYAITGACNQKALFVLYGADGDNGKSTEINVLHGIFGDYSMQADTQTFLMKRSEGIPNDLARLKGARLVTAIETAQGKRLNEPLIKAITGRDKIMARFLHQEFFEYQPEFTVFLAVNHRPEIQENSNALWRRIKIIPYEYTIPENERIEGYEEILLREANGIFAWIVKGCLAWQKEGLGEPPEVKKATSEYRNAMDTVSQFLAECCIQEENASALAKVISEKYRDFCKESGKPCLNPSDFKREMIDKKFIYQRETGAGANHGRVIWKKVRLNGV